MGIAAGGADVGRRRVPAEIAQVNDLTSRDLPHPDRTRKISTCVGCLLPHIRGMTTIEFITIKCPECAQNNNSENHVVAHLASSKA
ncbi:MAG: hypothetical protein WBD83_17785, partial [Xanthobacteraceae bacterium]